MNTVPKITLDYNCIINLFDHKSTTATSIDALSEIIRYSLSNKVNIAITTRAEADLENDNDEERRNEMLRRIELFPIIGSIVRLGVSSYGSEDMLGGQDRLFDELQKIIFPGLNEKSNSYSNKINDIDHLVGHIINNRDIFVTDDKDILKKKKELEASPGVLVMSPEECKSYLDAIEVANTKHNLENHGRNTGYSSQLYSGKVAFDYSNNNGIYAIGKGFHFFETKWSKASDTSIYLYSDPPSIAGIALAKGTLEIEAILDTNGYDFSSRARTVREGGIAILRNKNNIYAAVKVLDIKDESRLDDADEITFEYVIAKESNSFDK